MIAPVDKDCGPDCQDFVAKWSLWWRRQKDEPLAMLDCTVPYMELVGRNTRNMVRKAIRLYDYRPFDYNDHLPEIDAINVSKPRRQGRPMEGWYTEPARPTLPARLCETHRDQWDGAFRREDDVLVAYAHFCRVSDELIVPCSVFGHGDASAAINGMWAHLADIADVAWINYLHMKSATDTLEAFKRRLGFQEVDCAEM